MTAEPEPVASWRAGTGTPVVWIDLPVGHDLWHKRLDEVEEAQATTPVRVWAAREHALGREFWLFDRSLYSTEALLEPK